MNKKVFTVSEVNAALKLLIEEEFFAESIWISGEMTNVKFYQMGQQLYFTLTDNTSQINCVIYSNYLSRLKLKPENGLHVQVLGKIRFFQKRGTLTLQVFNLMLKGQGQLKNDFEQLKNKLLKEGLFDDARKKEMPDYPKKVTLITAWNSAAMWDFVSIVKSKAPSVEISIVPAVMQGDLSANSVIKALDVAKKYKKAELVVLLRGGGASEDLASFNDEKLVRKVADFSVPLISAIGHEVDFTLVDFVADLRMPTPTAAAEKVVLNYLAVGDKVDAFLSDIYRVVSQKYVAFYEKLQALSDEADVSIDRLFRQKQQVISGLVHRVELANPLHKFRQGFSINRLHSTREILRSVKQISAGDIIETSLADGFLVSSVNKIKSNNKSVKINKIEN